MVKQSLSSQRYEQSGGTANEGKQYCGEFAVLKLGNEMKGRQ